MKTQVILVDWKNVQPELLHTFNSDKEIGALLMGLQDKKLVTVQRQKIEYAGVLDA